MSKRKRLSYQPSNMNIIFLFCNSCNWGMSLHPAAGGFATQKEADQAFNAHKCEDYAK